MLPSPGWGPGAPGKQSGGLFSAKGGRQPRTVAAKRPDEVVAPLGIPPLPAEDTLSSLSILPAATYQTDDLIRLLANARIHLPHPGEGLRGLPCQLNRFGACWLMDPGQPLYSRRRAASPCCLHPVGGPERRENSPVDCFQRRAGGSPGRWPRSRRMRFPLPSYTVFSYRGNSVVAFCPACGCVPGRRPHPSPR